MDKIVLKFIVDILYLKGILCYEEYSAILDIKEISDMDKHIEKMLKGDFNVYKRGELEYFYDGGL